MANKRLINLIMSKHVPLAGANALQALPSLGGLSKTIIFVPLKFCELTLVFIANNDNQNNNRYSRVNVPEKHIEATTKKLGVV